MNSDEAPGFETAHLRLLPCAPLSSSPKELLRDGQPWTQYTYDPALKRISVKSGDPRPRLFETIVREQGIDLGGMKQMKVERITVVNTLTEAN